MAVVTKERQRILTIPCSNGYVAYEIYARYEGQYQNAKLIVEIKPVSSLATSINATSGGVDLIAGMQAISTEWRDKKLWVGDYCEILEADNLELGSGRLSVHITSGYAMINGELVDCSAVNGNVNINIYPDFSVYFDGTMIPIEGIVAVHQEGSLFTDTFKLGSTVCRTVNMSILKDYVQSFPQNVTIKDANNQVKFTLIVYSVDTTNIDFYDFVFVDKMVLLNANYDYSGVAVSDAQNILDAICQDVLDCLPPTMEYGGTIPLNYSSDISARDIVSWCAEINGCFARIGPTGMLQFVPFSNSGTSRTIDVNTCADFKLGEHHLIDRVYVELGTGTYYYPESTVNNTVYLNPNNQLITDSGNYTISDIVEHIQSVIEGFEFYSVTTSKCQIDQDTLPGDMLMFELDEDSYPSIAQIDWDFNTRWFGGYSLEIETKIQQETKLKGDSISNQIKIIVDRETGTIIQEINQLTDDLDQATSSFNQTANSLELRVANTETGLSQNNSRLESYETVVNIQADGVRISQGTTGAYVMFTATGMQIFVEGIKTAWAEADGFSAYELMIGGPEETTKWHLHEANGGATLMFLRS